jgi:uncharacterized membrane protein HdeD (DUF308 family)
VANDSMPLPSGARRFVQQEAARWWWAPLVSGVAWLLIGWFVMRANITSLKTVGVLVGVVFLVAAVGELGLAAFMTRGWQVVHVALGLLFTLAALWAFIRPINTFFALASVLGLLFFLEGVFYLARGIAMREVSPYWWVGVVGGSLFILTAIWMSTSDRVWNLAGRTVFILAAVGIYAIFRGISDIGLAFDLRHIGTAPEGREQEAVGARASFPAQDRRSSTDASLQKQQP